MSANQTEKEEEKNKGGVEKSGSLNTVNTHPNHT